MSKVCNERVDATLRDGPKGTKAPCGRPAMTMYGGRPMCWGCREYYEEAAKQLLKDAKKPSNPTRR